MLELVSGVLSVMGVKNIITATDGEEGFKKFQKEKPDIVITDWLMEPIDGIEMTLKIRRDGISVDRLTPVIVMTGFSAITRVAQARDIGATEFMVKPFTANELVKRIQSIIERPRDFVEADSFFGPDRRRRKKDEFKGSDKRSRRE